MPNGFARGLCGKGDYASQKKEVAIDFSLTPEAAATRIPLLSTKYDGFH